MDLTNDFRVGADRAAVWAALTDLERIAPLLPGAQLQEVEGEEYRGIVKVKVGPIKAQYKGTATLVEADEAAGRMVMRAAGRDTRGQGSASATITVTIADDGDGTEVHAATDLTISGKVAQFGRGVLADVSTKLIGEFATNLEADLGADPSDPVPDSNAGEALTGVASDATASESAATDVAGGKLPALPTLAAVGPGTTAPLPSAPATTGSRSPRAAAASTEPAGGTGTGPRRIDSPEATPVDLLDAAGNPLLKRLAPLGAGLGLLAVVLIVLRRRAGGG